MVNLTMTYTYEFEKNLPHLPAPLLADTTTQLLSALKPLLSTDEYTELLQESSVFIENDIIDLIQRHFEAASKNPDHSCYLNCINDGTSPGIYGELKGDILPRNPYLILEDDPYSQTVNPPDQSQRAASLINSSLKFIVSLRNETLKPDLTPKHGIPLSMNCYKILFGTSRIPHEVGGNSLTQRIKIKKYEHINDSRHIVVICNNQYYSLEVLTEYTDAEYQESKSKHKIWFNDYELSLILQSIIDEASGIDRVEAVNNSIGSVTTQSFSHWKMSRLEMDKSNRDNITTIDNALFVVILDSNSPISNQEKTSVISHGSSELLEGTNMQVGTCTSRWYDKLQLIVTKNSVAGVVWESTSMDGTAILRFISDIYTDSILKLAKNINGSEYTLFDQNVSFVSANGTISKPKSTEILINRTPELLNLIHLSETRLADLIHQHEYKTLTVKVNTHLISKFDLSIDSVLQIAFQIANYTLYGRMANTLEPITTRKFKDSRTELIPVQNELISKLVKLYITNSNATEKWEMFNECCKLHTKQYHNAMVGKGFERHFTAIIYVLKSPHSIEYLNVLNKDVPNLPPIPDLLTLNDFEIPLISNPIIEKLSSPEILISNCGNPAMHLFGIPPAADQGFGIGYVIHRDKVIITVSSKFRQTERFLDTFQRVTNDFTTLIKQKSNFLINITDSESRKLELQKLRIEQELRNVNSNLPLTRHPIELTVEKTPFPITNVELGNDDKLIGSRSRNSSASENKDDFDLLGGYGYFSFGDLDMRSDDLSREESYLNSHSNLSSKQHSSTNLHKTALENSNPDDIRHRLTLSANIRDKLLSKEGLSNDSSTSNLSEHLENVSQENLEANPNITKRYAGRELDMFNIS